MSEMLEFVYACGCPATEVGQSFMHGVLVCPVHQAPTAPYPHPEGPARATLTLKLDLEGATVEQLDRWAGNLEDALYRDDTVRVLESSYERRP